MVTSDHHDERILIPVAKAAELLPVRLHGAQHKSSIPKHTAPTSFSAEPEIGSEQRNRHDL